MYEIVALLKSGHGSPAGGIFGSILPAGAGMLFAGGGVIPAGGGVTPVGGGVVTGGLGAMPAGGRFPPLAGGGGLFAGGGVVGCVGIEIGGGVRFASLPPAPSLGFVPGGTLTTEFVPVLGPVTSSAPQPTATKIPIVRMLARTMLISTSTDHGLLEPRVVPAWTNDLSLSLAGYCERCIDIAQYLVNTLRQKSKRSEMIENHRTNCGRFAQRVSQNVMYR